MKTGSGITPIEMVVFDGDSDPTTPVFAIATALQLPLLIASKDKSFRVLSYYYDPSHGRMVLDIEPMAA